MPSTKRPSQNIAILRSAWAAGCTLVLLAIALFGSSAASGQNASVAVTLDPHFHTVAPPNGSFPPDVHHILVATIGMGIIALIMVVISLVEGVRFRSTVPLGLVLAAAFCVVPESVDNYLGGCYWAQLHSHILYVLMGREIDDYVVVMWWAFGAVLGYILYASLLRRVKTGTLWIAFALSGLADVGIEETLLRYGGIYTYYGHQPLVLLGYFPWWWLPTNVAGLFLSVAIAYRCRDWFNGWKSAFLFILMPVCYIGGFEFAAMPAGFAILGNFPPIITQICGILTCLLALVETGGIMALLLGRNPLALHATVQENPAAAHGGPQTQPI